MAETFDEARKSALSEFDLAAKKLRDIVADPTWNNLEFKPCKEACSYLARSLERIARLNTAQLESDQ